MRRMHELNCKATNEGCRKKQENLKSCLINSPVRVNVLVNDYAYEHDIHI